MGNHTPERSKLGSKKEIRPGVWQIRVSAGYKKGGGQKRVQRTVKGTARDADAEIIRLADEMGGNAALGDDITLDTYFWACFSPGRHASSTRANANTYDSIYRTHIAPHFGAWHLNDIDNIEVQRWINKLPPQSAPSYVRTLRAVTNQAYFDHRIVAPPMGPAYTFRLPRGRKTTPLPVWGALEVSQCLKRLEGDDLYALWLVMTGCGFSRSEALAVDWESVRWLCSAGAQGGEDWTAHIPINAAYTAEDGMKEPKNDKRYRSVPMRPLFANKLRGCRGIGPICKGLRGSRMSPGCVPGKWKALFDVGGRLEGLPFVYLNRMRATYSTLMQCAGVDWTIINSMQGRAPSSKVLETNYLNPYNETFEAAASAMERLLETS
ncbi:MAG: hypothetical protein RSB98_00970 [Raoultibacter sp.]